MAAPRKVLLDTDIGSDVDDALALGLILASPEALYLVAVTTVSRGGACGRAWPRGCWSRGSRRRRGLHR